jgi:hypothetical protein
VYTAHAPPAATTKPPPNHDKVCWFLGLVKKAHSDPIRRLLPEDSLCFNHSGKQLAITSERKLCVVSQRTSSKGNRRAAAKVFSAGACYAG